MIRIHNNLFPVNKYQRVGFETKSLSEKQKKFINHFNDHVKEGKILFETINCLCGYNEFDLIASVDANSLMQSVSVCRKCGLIMSNPRMTPMEYKNFYESDFYSEVYHRESLIEYSRIKYNLHTGKHILDKITRHKTITPQTTVLEIGCQGGWNLIPFQQKNAIVKGVDLSKRFTDIGKQFGLPVFQGDYNQINEKFDIIILNHVVEHLLYPVEELAMISNMLTTEGILYIATPNILNFTHDHLQNARTYYFTPLNIEYFCSKAGLKQITCGVTGESNMYGIYKSSQSAKTDDKALKINRKLVFKKIYRFSLKERISGLFFVINSGIKNALKSIKQNYENS